MKKVIFEKSPVLPYEKGDLLTWLFWMLKWFVVVVVDVEVVEVHLLTRNS